ncbi:MAG: hypothetical protein NPIRA05_15350 [Nitrospirales bacterium]|nr:MAG: hypothetical protein NPIRA05_15350 [Nitrospirales bacterium]
MKYTLGLLCLLASTTSFAAGYSGVGEITAMSSIYMQNGKPEFEMFGTWPDKQGCTQDRLIVGRDAGDNENTVNLMYSMLLAAYIADKTVELYIDCVSGVPIVKYVYLPDSPSS